MAKSLSLWTLTCLIVQSMASSNVLINEVNTHHEGSFIELMNLDVNELPLQDMGILVADTVSPQCIL